MPDTRLLIEGVVREVLTRIMKQQDAASACANGGSDGMKSGGKTGNRRVLVLVPPNILHVGKYLEFINSNNPACKLSVAYCSDIEIPPAVFENTVDYRNLNDISDRKKIILAFESYEEIYCVSPGIRLMESIANFNDEDFLVYLLMEGLIKGKGIRLVLGFDINRQDSGRLTKKLRELTSLITDSGISISTAAAPGSKEPMNAETGRELITCGDIDELWSKNVKVVYRSKKGVVTPLAADRARELGMTIILCKG